MGKTKKENKKTEPNTEQNLSKTIKNEESPKKKKQQMKKVKESVKAGLVEVEQKDLPTDEEKKARKEKNKLNKKLKKAADKSDTKVFVKPGQTIFVGNVPPNTKQVQLRRLFSPFGKVLSVRFRTTNGKVIFKHKMRTDSAAINAYVVLDSIEAVTKALELNGTLFKEQHLRVQKSDQTQENSNSKNTIFVGNLKSTTTDEALHTIFSTCGEIDYVRTLRHTETNSCNGTAFVCFKNPEAVGLALELEGTMLEERPIHVEKYSIVKLGAKQKRDSQTGQKKKPKVKGSNPLEKAAVEFRNKKKFAAKIDQGKPFKKPKQNKNIQGKTDNKSNKSVEKKKKSEFRGVNAEGMKKKQKKKVPSQMKRLANKIAPKE